MENINCINAVRKGDIITMNIDGSDKQYRVIKVLVNNIVEVVSMDNVGACMFNETGINTYSGGTLDKYLNTTYYNKLTSIAKAAIVDKTFRQDSWHSGNSGNPVYSGRYANSKPGTYKYKMSPSKTSEESITRHIYALSMQDVLDYVLDTSVGDGELQNYNIWKMFWNDEVSHTITNHTLWLRSSMADIFSCAWLIFGDLGYVGYNYCDLEYCARAAFTIDLSKMDYLIQ